MIGADEQLQPDSKGFQQLRVPWGEVKETYWSVETYSALDKQAFYLSLFITTCAFSKSMALNCKGISKVNNLAT